ncbi:hypothetical protein K3495_g3901 [Podosphaera aphanis]|nr:hypothetical protein K3495_g3901 [Podosphaera aphanis]
MPRRPHASLMMMTLLFVFFGFILIWRYRYHVEVVAPDSVPFYKDAVAVDQGILHGEAKAAKLENATVKAELGRSAWKLLHSIMAKFPDKPTEEDSKALEVFVHLFARLYPCGDCARHFQKILEQFPPQVASRSTAAVWACHVHNQVNKSLKKNLFDCSKIGDFYDCGCASGDHTNLTVAT